MESNDRSLDADEFVVDFRAQTGWGFPIALDFFFSGAGAALVFFSLIIDSCLGVMLGSIFLGIGAALLLMDLGNRSRFYKAFAKPKRSWISRGTFLITMLLVFAIIYALLGFPEIPATLKALIAAIAAMVVLYPGLALSYSPSIALWNSGFIPILFALHSLASGLSIGLIIYSPLQAAREWMIWLQLGLLLFLLIGTGIFLLVSSASTAGVRKSVEILLSQENRTPFVLVGLGLGIIAPLALLVAFVGGLSSWIILFLAALVRLGGDVGYRLAILRAGVYDPLI